MPVGDLRVGDDQDVLVAVHNIGRGLLRATLVISLYLGHP